MSTVTLWGPVRHRSARPTLVPRAFVDFDTAFNSLTRRAFGPASSTTPSTSFVPAAEILRDGQDAVVRIEVPGVDVQKDVTVEVKDGRLFVKGERRDERSSQDGGRTLREVRYGRFSRSFALPQGVSGESVTATHDNGVLSIRVAGVYAEPEVEAAHQVQITAAPATEVTVSAESAESAESATDTTAQTEAAPVAETGAES